MTAEAGVVWTKLIDVSLAIPIGIGKLLWYFQAPGMLSIAGWAAALAVLAVFYRRPRRRHVAYATALGLAVLGFACGHLNSISISRIRTDVTDKLNEARAAQEEATRQQVAERRRMGLLEDIHFAEDDRSDVKERERQADTKKSIYELASEGKLDQVEDRQAELEAGKSKEYEEWNSGRGKKAARPEAAPPEQEAAAAAGAAPEGDEAALDRFEYRRGGKKERAAGRKEKDAVIEKAMKREEFVGGRAMKESDVQRAQRLDVVNLFFCRTTLWLALIMLLADYLFRSNRTFWTVWPLPVAGRLLDAFFPKQHAVLMEPDSPAFLKGYLETAARKGESFLYFGETDLWRAPAVLRWRIPPLPEIFLLLLSAALWLGEYVGLHIARGYRALMAGRRRRASGAAPRGSLALRTGDRILDATDRVVRALAPHVSRAALFVGRRLREGGLALRTVWVTAQARYPLRLAPLAMLLLGGRGAAQAVNRRRGKPQAAGGGPDAFLLGRADPERIGRPRWWDRGRFGVAVSWAIVRYRRYAEAHPNWQKWVERQAAHLRRLDAILFREGLWSWVIRLHYDRASLPADRLFAFEAVWFNRYACCIIGQEAARSVMPDLLYFLRCRLVPRAQAWQTVNIVWDLPLPLDRETVDDLAFRCRESNLRLMIVSRGGWARAMADLFDERAEEQIGPDDRVRIERMAVLADRIAEQRGWTT